MSDFNHAKRLKEVTITDIQQGFKFESGLGNIIKWYLIGLYLINDKMQIEKLEELFTKDGSLSDKRPYKTEAQTVYKAIIDHDIKIFDKNNKEMSLAEIINCRANEMKPSVGMLYRNFKKAQVPVPNPDKELKALAKQALESENINTDGITNAMQLVKLAQGQGPLAQIARDTLEQAEKELEYKALKDSIPEVTSDNVAQIVTITKDYLAELYSFFPDEFNQITDYILELQTQVMENVA